MSRFSKVPIGKNLHKKAVILGASGFIGTNLAEQLCAEAWDVVCVSRDESPYWPDSTKFLSVDLRRQSNELLDEMRNATIFHLFGSARPSKNTSHAAIDLTDEVVSTLNYLELTRDHNCCWVFGSSGGTIYGEPNSDRIDENHPTNPISAYGIQKLAMEHYFRLYHGLYGTDVKIARIANPYGPHQNPDKRQGLIAVLISRILRNEKIEIWGDGTNVRDYIFVYDVVEALKAIAIRGQNGKTYNVGSGTGVSVNSILDLVSKNLSLTPEIVYLPPRGVDVRTNVLNTDRIFRELSWEPVFSLEKGLLQTCKWLEERVSMEPQATDLRELLHTDRG